MAQKFDDSEGVWRTIGGRRVFIRTGQSLADAMIESGKFKNLRSDYRKAKEEIKKEEDNEVYNKGEAEAYYSKQDKETIEKDLEERKNRLDNDYYDEKDKAKYEKFYEEGKKYYDEKYGKENDLKAKQEAVNKSFEENQKQLREQLEKGNKPYELEQSKISDAYKTYREKRDKLEGIEEDELGNRNYDTMKDATWTGKEYTTEEYLANLEDENWHTERRMILEAGLTKEQIDFIKDNTKFHNGSPNLDKEITEELIKGAKGEEYRKPSDILNERKNTEITELESELKDISQFGKYDEKGNYREGVKQDYKSYSDKKKRYEELSGKTFDDSNIKIDYDENKTYEFPNGKKIDQNLMKEWYSGENPEKVKSDIEYEKSVLYDKSPKNRERAYAQIKEMEKYYNSMEKYESRISDDFGTKDWKEGYGNQFGEGSWKGTKSNSGLYGKDKIKAIDDEIKKAYPNLKTSRKTAQGGYTDSFSYSIMESDKPILRSIDDFSDDEIERLYNKGYNKNWYNSKEEFKESIKRDLEKGHISVNQYGIDEDYRLTPYGKQVFKDIMKVSNAYNYDESASQVDYFNTGHYINLGVGKDSKPYKTTGSSADTNKYATAKHEGFGDYNKDYIPVYNNKIDYSGDFSRADLSKLSNEELSNAINEQSRRYNEATNERLGDQRTRNGKMDKIFNTAKKQKYESGMNKLNEEINKRDLPRYNIYNENGMIMVSSPTKEMAERQLNEMYETDKKLQKQYGWKELPKYTIKEGKVDEYLNERQSSSMSDKIRDEAYRKYMKSHPNSKMTLDKFLKKK